MINVCALLPPIYSTLCNCREALEQSKQKSMLNFERQRSGGVDPESAFPHDPPVESRYAEDGSCDNSS